MVARPAGRAHPAAGQPLDDTLVRNFDVHDLVDADAHLLEGLGLRHGAGHAVQNKAVFTVVLREAFFDDADDHVVGDKRAGIDKGLGFHAHLGFVFHRFTKNVTGADGRDVQLVAYDLGLRALTGAGRA